MNEVAVEVLEKHQTIPLILKWLSGHFDALCLEFRVRSVEIGDRDGDMPHTGSLHTRIGPPALRGDDLDEDAILRTDKVITLILMAQAELQRVDVPFCQRLRVRRGDCKVLDSSEHKPGV